MSEFICPECVSGKHVNCDGTAWDLDNDQPVACTCTHREVEETVPITERCTAITDFNEQCRRFSHDGSRVCRFHQYLARKRLGQPS